MIQNSINDQITNGVYNITLSGNVLYTGAYSGTYNLTGTTNISFPTSGTVLSTTDIGTNVQAYSLQLSSVSAIASNGILARVASGSVMARNISGTSARILITNPDGVSGNPTIDIDSTYAGQNTITTLGTIGTGTWQGNPISGQFGGTGVNNAGKTITLGGNLTTSGAFATTITVTAATNVTLPVSGTLLSSAAIGTSVEAWSAQLDALSTLSTNGLIARTAANTVTARTIAGTTNLITVTNGDGVAGNPTISVGTNVSQINVAETRGASINMASNQIKNAEMLNYYETTITVTAASSQTIDVTQGNIYVMNQAVNTTLAFTTGSMANAETSGFTLIRIKDATATARTVTWPASVKWPSGTAPTLTQTTGAVDILEFFTTDGGTTWRGFAAALDSK